MPDEMNLPADLREFLAAERSLEYDVEQAEPGLLTLRRLDALELGAIYGGGGDEGHPPGENEEPGAGEDPHLWDDDPGYYVVPAVDLVASCSGDYSGEALLAWIPGQGMYATWDESHFDIVVFPGASWTDIAANPLPYLNAQWSNDPPGYYLAPWLHGYEHRTGLPWD